MKPKNHISLSDLLIMQNIIDMNTCEIIPYKFSMVNKSTLKQALERR